MAFGNFDFAQGTDFEQGIMRFFWKKYPTNIMNFCKPDIYDCNNDIFYEIKYTRPYFDKDPAKYKDSVDWFQFQIGAIGSFRGYENPFGHVVSIPDWCDW